MARIPGKEAPATTRSRHLRGLIVGVLKIPFDRQSAIGYSFDRLSAALAAESRVSWSAAEIEAALGSLAGDGLIEIAEGGWLLTGKGNEFYQSGCDWARIDR